MEFLVAIIAFVVFVFIVIFVMYDKLSKEEPKLPEVKVPKEIILKEKPKRGKRKEQEL